MFSLMRWFLVFVFSGFLLGCGGGGGGSASGNAVTTKTAVLLDGVVSGVTYDAGSGVSGVTNANGQFQYVEGQAVSFYIGGIFLGQAQPVSTPAGATNVLADSVITPLELAGVNDIADPQVLNRVRLLMALDSDGNPQNGIQIDSATQNALQNVQLNNFSDSFDPTAALQAVSQAIGRNVVLEDSDTAKQHLCDSLGLSTCGTGGGSSNNIPTISGTPTTSVNVGSIYSFTPTASDADNDTLTFSIINEPAWATFDTTTGKLSGTPAAADIGTTGGIVISVKDSKNASASLTAFDLTVVQPNRAPTIGGTPATSVNVGSIYSFTPTASDADSDTLTFSITNEPAWATFDKATGKLSGTPTAAGISTGIVIAVTDDKSSPVSLAAFNLAVVDPYTQLTRDTDNDGTPDVQDADDDNDGTLDNEDYRPLDNTIKTIPSFTGRVNSSAQTYVRADNANTNYNNDAFIMLRSLTGSFATAGLLYFDIPATVNGKRTDNISSASLTIKSDTETDPVRIYASTNPAFPAASAATWGNTQALFGTTAYGQIALTAGASGSTILSQCVAAGKIVFVVDETGNDARKRLVKNNTDTYLDLTFEEIDPTIVNVTPVANSRATQSGGEQQYQISLTKAPTSDVYVPLVLANTTTATLTSATILTFTPANYNTPQTVTIKGKNDNTQQGTKDNKLLVYPLHSLDNHYNGHNPADPDFKVYATLVDDVSGGAAKSGQAFTATADYSNPNKTASFELVGAPMGMSIQEKTGVIRWQPDSSQVGSHDFTITAKENSRTVYNKRVNVTVELVAANPTNAFYVVPGGTVANPTGAQGSITNPYTNIETALAAAVLNPNKRTVYVRGGRYDNTAVTIGSTIDGESGNQVILTRLPGERVKFNFSGISAFTVEENASYVVIDGFEVDGKSIQDHDTMLRNNWWNPLGDRSIGGGQAFNVDGNYITVRNNVIHDVYQKAVNIYKGRYVNVHDNVIYNVGHSSLSGGHGIMRKWERNFHVNPTDSVDKGLDVYTNEYPYRFDFFGNMLLRVEQRIYSRVFNKGYSNLTIDEGKPIAIDETQDTDPKGRIAHNLVLYGGIDHIRLKQNPNMEVHNNSVIADLSSPEIADGITDKSKLVNLKFYGNLVASKGIAVDVADSFIAAGVDEDPNKLRKYDNFVAGGGSITEGNKLSGITNKGTAISSLFADISNKDFRSVVTGEKGTTGVSESKLNPMLALANEYAIDLIPGGWVHNHVRNTDLLLSGIPSTVFDTSTVYIGPSSIEEGHQALFIKFIDSDGKWLYTKREVNGVDWNNLQNKDLTNTAIYDLPNVSIQKCSNCKGAYVYQLVLPHEWFGRYGNDDKESFLINNGKTRVEYLDVTNTNDQKILDYSAAGKTRSY